MNDADRDVFDACFARVFQGLPARLRRLIENEVVVIVDDQPSDAMLDDLERDEGDRPTPDGLLGLHTGVPVTEWSIEDHAREPTTIYLFRLGILAEVRWDGAIDATELERQIRVTLLHEIGHHYGLDEDDLDQLGYA